MNNFSDLLATDLTIIVCAELNPIRDNGDPWVSVAVNGTVLQQGFLNSAVKIEKSINLLDNLLIEINLQEKKYSQEFETAGVINSIRVDDFEFIPTYTGGNRDFITYNNDRNMNAVTNYLGFNGQWRLYINEPFYRWRHRHTGQGVLLEPLIFNT